MSATALRAVLQAYAGYEKPRVLLVDDDLAEVFAKDSRAVSCSQAGIDPSELWSSGDEGSFALVVLSAPRTAREMFRVLALVERLVQPDGKILLLPPEDSDGSPSDEVRPEATEIFCGAYPVWARRQIEGNVVELKRSLISNLLSGLGMSISREQAERALSLVSTQQASAQVLQKHVVSLSVFGDSRFGGPLWEKMPEFVVNYALAHHAVFPGYELRIHHDEHLFHANGGDVLTGLARLGLVRLVYIPGREGQGKCERMLHRLMPAWDPEVDVVICRDVDSLPTWRDRCAVEEFIASGLDVGVIHDNPEHGGMMGGLTHVRARVLRKHFPTFEDFIAGARRTDIEFAKHGADQDYLNELIGMAMHVPVLEHSLRSRGVRTIQGSTFRTAIAEPDEIVIDSVSDEVRGYSDSLTNYMGSSGYDTLRAREFYDRHSPIASIVREIEGNQFRREALDEYGRFGAVVRK